MSTLKDLFGEGESLTLEQLEEKITAGGFKFADLSTGEYVAKGKYDALAGQVTDLKGQIAQRDTDLDGLNARLEAAQADASKLAEAKAELAGLRSQYETDKQAYESRLAQQAYEFQVRENAGAIKFSSAAARRDFERQAIEKKFQMQDGKLVGFTEWTESYKTENPGAVMVERHEPDGDGGTPPTIVLPGRTASGGSTPRVPNLF